MLLWLLGRVSVSRRPLRDTFKDVSSILLGLFPASLSHLMGLGVGHRTQLYFEVCPHGVSLAAERIWSLTERGSRATSGARHLDDRVDQAPCLTLVTNAAVLVDDDLPRQCARRVAAHLTLPSTTRSTSTAPAPSTSKPSFVAKDTARCAHRPLDPLAAGRRDQIRSAAKATQPPSNRTGFRPDAATTAHGPRFRDNQTGLDCGTGRPGERSLSAL